MLSVILPRRSRKPCEAGAVWEFSSLLSGRRNGFLRAWCADGEKCCGYTIGYGRKIQNIRLD